MISLARTRLTLQQYETLRIWGPVQSLAKRSPEPQRIKISGHEYQIPPNTFMHPNFQVCHTNPDFWGADNMQWKPERWTRKDANGRESLMDAPDSTLFIGWSTGPRVCPGKKFSQVEYIAVLATILRSYRVKPAQSAGESFDQARKRLTGVLEDCYFMLTVKMKRPNDTGLVLEKR